MKILYIIPSLLTGGAEALVCQWALYLQRSGHSAEVCTMYAAGPFARNLETNGIRVHNLNHDPGIEQYRLRRKYDLRLVMKLARTVRTGNYDIVHVHLFPALFHTALLSLFINQQPYLYSEHSVLNRRRSIQVLKPVDRFLYSRFRQIVPVSEEVRRALSGWLPDLQEKMRVVPNGVDARFLSVPAGDVLALRRELGLRNDEQVVLFAGRLIWEKGVDVLMAALPRLVLEVDHPVRILIAGDGPVRARLEKESRQFIFPLKVSFLGNRSDMPRLFALADLLVMPSRWEGLPMVLLEALAARTPVVATPVGGIPEVLSHDHSGWIVPRENPQALAEGIARLLKSEELRRRLSDSAFQLFEERYSSQVTISRLIQIYQENVSATAGGPPVIGEVHH